MLQQICESVSIAHDWEDYSIVKRAATFIQNHTVNMDSKA